MAKEGSKVKKVIRTLATIVKVIRTLVIIACVTVGAIFVGKQVMNYIDSQNGAIGNGGDKELKAVQNIKYDKDNFMFTWDSVENADGYEIEIYGELKETNTNSYFYIPTKEQTTIKVRAKDSTYEYKGSEWSESYTYTIEKNQDLYYDVNVFVNNLLSEYSSDLKKVVSMYAKDNGLYIQLVCEYNNKEYFYNLEASYDEEITSIKQAIELAQGRESKIARIISDDYTVEYDSFKHLLKSNAYVGELDEYRQKGYNISVVSSQTVKEEDYKDGSLFRIYAILKIEKDGVVKYAQAAYRCQIKDPSNKAIINYTLKLENKEDRSLRELSFNELTGEFHEYAEKLEGVNKIISDQ